MKKLAAMLLLSLSLVFTGCTSSTVASEKEEAPKAVFQRMDSHPAVVVKEEKGELIFTSEDRGHVSIRIGITEELPVKRIILYDGENILRIKADEAGIVLFGDKLEIFKDMVEEGREITVKGRIGRQNYYSARINPRDAEVIGLIFGEDQI